MRYKGPIISWNDWKRALEVHIAQSLTFKSRESPVRCQSRILGTRLLPWHRYFGRIILTWSSKELERRNPHGSSRSHGKKRIPNTKACMCPFIHSFNISLFIILINPKLTCDCERCWFNYFVYSHPGNGLNQIIINSEYYLY